MKRGKGDNSRKKTRLSPMDGAMPCPPSASPRQAPTELPYFSLLRPHPSVPRAPGGGTYPGYGAEGLVHTPVPFTHGDITPFSSHCLLTAVEVCGESSSGSAQAKDWNTFFIKTDRNRLYFTTVIYTYTRKTSVTRNVYSYGCTDKG